MTEPEELEEDLFADLYDGDDVPAKAEPITEPDYTEPAQPSAPITYPPFPYNEAQQPDPSHINDLPAKDEPMYGNGTDGDTGPAWNQAQVGSNNYNEGPVDHEPAPIGIKEDGNRSTSIPLPHTKGVLYNEDPRNKEASLLNDESHGVDIGQGLQM
ncbi:hypothetical protein MMC21_008240 [Puttea exsequens]|nr:hypothetical protein [Puttea exsequens]